MGTTKFRGLTIRDDPGTEPRYRITFTYKGIQCRETLDFSISPKNEKFAANMLGEIKNKIALGTFRYSDYFPDSPKLKLFGVENTGAKVHTYLTKYIEICKKRGLSHSTMRMYEGYAEKEFGDIRNLKVADLTAAHIRNWVLEQKSSKKTIQNKLNFLGPALDEAITDGLITTNPLRQVDVSKYIKDTDAAERDVVDPFNPKEVEAILAAFRHEQERNLFEFAFETGLRTGELIGLKWDDIDWLENKVHITRAVVQKVVKTPKTTAGKRIIDLSDRALAALIRQKEHTALYREWVFHDPKNAERWNDDKTILAKSWKPALERAKVRYRKPYNTRHTFATMHISRNANLWWLAKQMGHKSPDMLFRHYGTYLEEFSHVDDAGQNRVQTRTISHNG
ncbi:MAG: tyrosine-type recombinase/integrase [Alishewanella aestuarii]